MRGLKQPGCGPAGEKHAVASFTDAWIETKRMTIMGIQNKVASFTDAWIETFKGVQTSAVLESHLLQMRGLKRVRKVRKRWTMCRIFYRCVD